MTTRGTFDDPGLFSGPLPAPKLSIVKGKGAGLPATYLVNPATVNSALLPVAVQSQCLVRAKAVGIPAEYLLPERGLRLELMRYRPATQQRQQLKRAYAGWVHPSNGPLAANGRFGGGQHSDVAAAIAAIRISELPVIAAGQSLDVMRMALGFMQATTVRYRTVAGQSAISVISPLNRRNMFGGTRFSYEPSFSPGYFRVRYSAIDLDDPKGGRIYGPMSELLVISHPRHPFRTDAVGSAQVGRTVAFAVATNPEPHNPLLVTAWVGTRLP